MNAQWNRGAACLALALGVAGCASALAIDWIELGPAPIMDELYTGRVSALACSLFDGGLYYAACADGGVLKSTDGGATWTPLTDQMPTSAMGALALDPLNESIVYAGTGEANYAHHSRPGIGIYKSTDGGDTWQILGSDVFAGRCFSRLLIDPTNPQRLYAAITRAGGFPEMAAAKGHPQATGPVGVFRSDDGGVTWTQLLTGLPNLSATDLAMNPDSPSVLYAAIGHIFGSPSNGVYKSTDGGDSWSKLAGGLPTATMGRISVAVAPSQPARLYAMLTYPSDASGGGASLYGVYRSDNSGATWTRLNNAPSGLQATYGWYLSIIGVHPSDSAHVYIGGLNFVRSYDAGATWLDVTPPHVDMHAVTWDANGALVVGEDGGVHRSWDDGNGWEQLNMGLGVIQCYAGLSTHSQQEQRLFIGTQDNGTLNRAPAGEDGIWISALGGDGGWTQADPQNPAIVFAEYQGTGNLFKSADIGYSYSFSGTGISTGDRNCFMPPYLMKPTDSNKMLYGSHRIYRSVNKGANWTPVSGDLTGGGTAAIRSMALAPSNPDVVYAATNDGRIQRSNDFGSTWTLVKTGVDAWPRITRELFVAPNDPLTVYLAEGNYGQEQVQRSTDGGVTWEALDANFPDIPAATIAVDVRGTRPVIYVGAEDGLYRSVDEGASWHRYGVGLPKTPVIDLALELGRARLIACTQGRGLWKIAIGLPGDLNGDGAVNAFDIDAFILALTAPAEYAVQYPELDPVLLGDLNGDGTLNAFDIDPFVNVLTP